MMSFGVGVVEMTFTRSINHDTASKRREVEDLKMDFENAFCSVNRHKADSWL